MKKILLCLFVFVSFTSQAQLLKKLKEKAGNVVNGNSNSQQSSQPNNSSGSNNNTIASNTNYTYLNNKEAIEKYGTKICGIPAGYELLYIDGIQYWLDNGNVRYYLAIGKPLEGQGEGYSDIKTILWDGKTMPGSPKDNKLLLTKDTDPPCIKGTGTFDEETADLNYDNIAAPRSSNTTYVTSSADANYKSSFTITVNSKKIGTYQGTVMGVYSYKSGKVFFTSSTSEYMPNEVFVDGKLTYKSNEIFAAVAGDPQCSADGTKAVFNIMLMSKVHPSGEMAYLFSNGKMVQPFTDGSQHGEYKLMNSGQLLKKLKDATTNSYRLNGSEVITLPTAKGALDFFSDENVNKWASHEPYKATYFSDGIAIKETNKAEQHKQETNVVFAPEKLVINGKPFMVWLQWSGNDIYLCKKEM